MTALQELFASNRQYVTAMTEEHEVWIQQQKCLPFTSDPGSQMTSSRTVNTFS